jgi:prepilin-type N-terminal cleavage/methylation domain-containing protein
MGFSFRRIAQGRSYKGFTLLELSIVMAIVGLLTVSIVGFYATVAKRQREAKTRGEMESIREAVLGYYQNYLTLPVPDSGYRVPIDDLDLPPTAQKDEIYTGKYYAYVASNDEDTLKVDGQPIGNTAMVLISSGSNLKFEEENGDLTDGEYAQDGTTADFDDILIYVSANELASSVSWRREIEAEVAVLNRAAKILAENDDDGDGFVDEDSTDAPGNSDGMTDWNLVTGTGSLVNAGLLHNADHIVDPWGTEYLWDTVNHKFYCVLKGSRIKCFYAWTSQARKLTYCVRRTKRGKSEWQNRLNLAFPIWETILRVNPGRSRK